MLSFIKTCKYVCVGFDFIIKTNYLKKRDITCRKLVLCDEKNAIVFLTDLDQLDVI